MFKYNFIILTFLVSLILSILGLKDKAQSVNFFVNSSFYIMSALLIHWLILIKSSGLFKEFISRKNLFRLFACLLMSLIVFTAFPTKLRVHSDETNLLGISKSFFHYKSALNTTSGENYYGNYHSVRGYVPKRPVFFPYLVSLVHSIKGYSPHNVYIVNFFALAFFFFIIFHFFHSFLSIKESFAFIGLFLSYPIFIWCTNSGGFDFLNLTFLALCLSLTYFIFVKKFDFNKYFPLLICSFYLFFNIRYESIIHLFTFLVIFTAFKKIHWKEVLDKHWHLSLVFVYLLPSIWQRKVIGSNYEQKNKSLFSVSNFTDHFEVLFKGHLKPVSDLPYNHLLNYIVFILFVIFVIKIFQKKSKNINFNWPMLIYFLSTFVVANIIFLSHHFGRYDHPTQFRFFLIYSAFMPVLAALLYKNIYSKKKSTLLYSFTLLSLVIYFPITQNEKKMNSLTLHREVSRIYDFIEDKNKNNLFIYHRPGQLTAYGYGSVNFKHFVLDINGYKKKLNNGLFEKIYLIQRLKTHSNEVYKDDKVISHFVIQKELEFQVSNVYKIRISEIIK